jgi:rhomboid protease GluP
MSRGSNSVADRVLEIPVTWLITAINLGVFLIAWTQGEHGREGLSLETLIAYGAVGRHLLWAHDYWRLLTAVFLHGGLIHLFLNSWMLLVWCGEVERTVGSLWFTFAYVTIGIGASAVSMLCHPVISVGASGALFGILSVVLAILYRRLGSWESFMANRGVRQLLMNVVFWLVIGFGVMGGTIDNYAHLGGFLFGIPCGFIVERRRGRYRPIWIAGLVAYILVWLGVVVAACIPGMGFGQIGE